LSAFSRSRYSTLGGYAGDLVEIGRELKLKDAVLVGHSVSSMIGVLAAQQDPTLFSKIVMVGPSPCYINDGDYLGGFERSEIEGLLELLDSNPVGWAEMMAPAIMGNPERPELSEELRDSFCRTDPMMAQHFARVTFLSDNRADLAGVTAQCLILQCEKDAIAPAHIGEYVRERIANSKLVRLSATGHCPHLSSPSEVSQAIQEFLVEA
jgi:sigma-B regulation protein RsbQ